MAMVTFWCQGLDDAAPQFVCFLRRFNDALTTPLVERHSGTINMIKQGEKKHREPISMNYVDADSSFIFASRNLRLKLLSTVDSALSGDVFEMITVTKFQRMLFSANFN